MKFIELYKNSSKLNTDELLKQDKKIFIYSSSFNYTVVKWLF